MDVTLVEGLMSVALAALSMGTVALGYLASYLAKKSKANWLDSLIYRVENSARKAVEFVGQTFSDELKDRNHDGKLDSGEAKEAFRRAYSKAKAAMGPALWGEVLKGFGGDDHAAAENLKTEIEAAVGSRNSVKKALKAAPMNPLGT